MICCHNQSVISYFNRLIFLLYKTFALFKPTFSLPLRPTLLARVLPSKAKRSPTNSIWHPTASADRLAPFIFGARALDQWAITRWLLLGKPPGCLCTLTSFITVRSFRGLSWWSGLFPSRRWSLSPIVSLADLDPCYFEVISSIQSLPWFGTALAAYTETFYLYDIKQPIILKYQLIVLLITILIAYFVRLL